MNDLIIDIENGHIKNTNGEILGLISLEIKGYKAYLNMIEIFNKRKGIGERAIRKIFDISCIQKLEGFILCEKIALNFWSKLGSEIYYINHEGYSIEELIDSGMESPFILTRESLKERIT